MLHARRIISPSPVGPLSRAELLNLDPRWVRLETLRLLEEFWHTLERGESVKPVFVAFANVLLLSLAATCNTPAPTSPTLWRCRASSRTT